MKRQNVITELFETMDVAKRAMHTHMQFMLEGCPISRSQLELLLTIHHSQPVTAKQLAQKLQLTAGAVSQLIEELDKRQYIDRQTDPTDRRKQVVRISAAGDKLLGTIHDRRRHMIQGVIQNLSDDELATWLKIQKQMINTLKDSANIKRKDTK